MKYIPLLSLLLISPLSAQNEPDQKPPTAELLQSKKDFLNLTEEQRDEFQEHYEKAAGYFQQKRIFETLDALDDASKIIDNSVAVLNLYGSCYVEIRSFKKALLVFEKAQKLNPQNQSVNFNVAEILFVTRQWEKAHEALTSVFNNLKEGNTSLSRLVEFKILLCKIKLGKESEALLLSEKYDYQDDSPFYYYSRAAIAYSNDNNEDATGWTARASRIFKKPAIIAPWQDTLIEFGYIKSFYGEDLVPGE